MDSLEVMIGVGIPHRSGSGQGTSLWSSTSPGLDTRPKVTRLGRLLILISWLHVLCSLVTVNLLYNLLLLIRDSLV